MIDRRWVRTGGVAGILFVVLLALSIVVSGNSPDATSSTAKMVSYINDNRGAVLASNVLGVVASVVILWFVGVFSQLLRSDDDTVPFGVIALASGVAASTVGAVSSMPLAALALVANQPGGLDNSSATRMLYELGNLITGSAISIFLMVFLAAIGIGMVRRAFAAPWLGWLGLSMAVVNFAGGVIGLTTTNSAANIVGLVGLVGFGVVVLASSIYMLRYRPAAAA